MVRNMNTEITITKENTSQFPIHTHDKWEYMLYIKGKGLLKTDRGDYPFCENTFIAVAPFVKHGSCSDGQFVNICIHTDKKLSVIENDITLIENATEEIGMLFRLIGKAYFEKGKASRSVEYLILALEDFLSENQPLAGAQGDILKIHNYILENFQSSECDISSAVGKSGFSDDYCRIMHKRVYGLTPHEYLVKLRMEYAKVLLESYGSDLKILEIAQLCGYKDSLYFSRQFKKYYGASPKEYKSEGTL